MSNDMKLSERAMLVHLHCGMWSGTMSDQEVTDATAERYNAEQGAGRYTKQLIGKRFLSHVGSKINHAKGLHKAMTLPWGDNGERILTCMAHAPYTQQMRLERLGVEAAAAEFAAGWPDNYLPEAQQRLGKMFDPEDYPSREEVEKKFYLDTEIRPVPEAGDFRASLSNDSVKVITKGIEKRTNQRVAMAMDDVFHRVIDVCGKMAERLRLYEPPQGDGKAKNHFRDSLVYNVNEIADLLPTLNITGDQRLDALRQQLKDQLVEHSPEILRVDAKARSATADRAEKLLKKVSSYLS